MPTDAPDLSILSYNLRFHAAYDEAFAVAHEYNVDAICLQECKPNRLADVVGEFTLAAHTNKEYASLAIYYRTDQFKVAEFSTKRLPYSLYERVCAYDWEHLLITRLHDIKRNRQILVGSLHATHLVTLNAHRRRQLTQAFERLNDHQTVADELLPTILVGDYNYPFFHGGLRKFVKQKGYKIFIPEDFTYRNRFFRGKFDLASVRHVAHVDLSVLPQGASDHMPVQMRVTY